MIDFVKSETKKIIFNCCSRYAKQKSLNVEDVQLILGLNEEGNTYSICEKYVQKIEYSIMQVLGLKIDFLGYSNIAPPFILKSLVRYSEKHKIDVVSTKILCVPCINENGKNDLQLFLYENYDKFLEEITLEDLFNEEDIEMPNI
jgi:hypothetical protein